MKLKHIIILQNKIDLVRDTQAKDQQQEILKFVQGTAGPQSLWRVLSLLCHPKSLHTLFNVTFVYNYVMLFLCIHGSLMKGLV